MTRRRALAARRARPMRRVCFELVLDRAERPLGLLHVALQLGDPPELVARRAGGLRPPVAPAVSPRAPARGALAARPLAGALLAARRSSRTRESSAASRPRSCAGARPRLRSCGCQRRRGARDRATRTAACRRSAESDVAERLARDARSRWFVGSSIISTFAPELTEARQRQPAPLAARQPVAPSSPRRRR